MSEYKNGKVYKIIHNQSDIVYIGSTLNRLNDRFYNHKKDYENGKVLSIYKYFTKYGIENFKIILIKEYRVVDRKHLLMYEQLWMNKIKNINIIKSFQPLFKERNKENKKIYRKENKEKIEQKDIIYRNNHKDKKAAYDKEYREKNKEKINEYLHQTYDCDCGSIISINKKSRHLKSNKHINYINNLV